MKNKGWVALAALFLFLTGAASAAYQINLDPAVPVVNNRLTVTVLNDGMPQQEILVQFILNSGTPILSTTDSQGKASFIPLAAGNLTIQVTTMNGIQLANTQVSVTDQSATTGAAPRNAGGSGTYSNMNNSGQENKSPDAAGIKATQPAVQPAAATSVKPEQTEAKTATTPKGSVPGFEAIIAMAAFLALYMLRLKGK